MPKKFWDEERIARLKKMHADGESYFAIALYFDCSRSAVAGACHRFGLSSAAQPRRPKQPVRQEDRGLPRNAPKPDPAPIVPLAAEPLKHGLPGEFMVTEFARPDGAEIKREDLPELFDAVKKMGEDVLLNSPEEVDKWAKEAFPHMEGILLDDLKPESCRWPLNDGGPFRFCGCRKLSLKGPYCAEHTARAGGGQPKLAYNPKAKSGLSVRRAVGRI